MSKPSKPRCATRHPGWLDLNVPGGRPARCRISGPVNERWRALSAVLAAECLVHVAAPGRARPGRRQRRLVQARRDTAQPDGHARALAPVLINDPAQTRGVFAKVFVASGKTLPSRTPAGIVRRLPQTDLLQAAGTPAAAALGGLS